MPCLASPPDAVYPVFASFRICPTMLDIKWIRENPKALADALKKRSWSDADAQSTVDGLVASDEARRAHVLRLQHGQERRNAASKEIGKAMAAKDAALAERLKAEVGEIKALIQDGEAEERRLDKELNDALAVIPNLPLEEIKGIKLTKIGFRRYSEEIHARMDTRSREYFWIAGIYKGHDNESGTDCEAVDRGYVAITPHALVDKSSRVYDELAKSIERVNAKFSN